MSYSFNTVFILLVVTLCDDVRRSYGDDLTGQTPPLVLSELATGGRIVVGNGHVIPYYLLLVFEVPIFLTQI